jgi:CubicO group peptidase (beta-lactamase class C family)
MKYYKNSLRDLSIAVLGFLLTSCAAIRGYFKDGRDGPGIYSFKHHAHDTVANGHSVFHFPVDYNKGSWIDTLHFYTQGKYCQNITLPDAMKDKSDTQGVLIIHNDTIIYEKYWGDFSSDRLATVFSVTKSINSLMCGIAVDDGYIHSIDDAVTEYIPELKNKETMWQRLTIRHLLDMQSGLDFDDTYYLSLKQLKRVFAIAKLNYGHNVVKQIRGLKFRCEPGTEHRYESISAQILGVVIERASKKRFVDYLSEKVWKPLQMESPALMNIDSKKHRVAHTFGGLTLTMKDLAKIGRLYLNNGMWNGQRIVSEEWIRQSTEYDKTNNGYHFNWYNVSNYGADATRYPGYYALGICAQVLYVNPYKNLVMVRVGKDNNYPIFIPEVFNQLSNCDIFRVKTK